MADEERLAGGNASGAVVRLGDTVRKPWLPTSQRTNDYLSALRAVGLDVPEPLGRDEQGRFVLSYVPGRIAMDLQPLDRPLLRRIGELVRSIHDASAGLPVPADWPVLLPAEGADLVCHNDLAAWNLVIDRERLVFIDWDGAGPSTRLWDLAYAAVSFGLLVAGEAPEEAAGRLAAFVDGYGADGQLRAALPHTMARRAEAMHELLRTSHETGVEPWATMYVSGHGEHWARCAAYIAEHRSAWADALRPG